MDKHALIIGASGGIGGAVRDALVARGWAVLGLSRGRDGLDLTDEAAVERVLGSIQRSFDLVLVATGALEIDGAAPEKTIKALDAKAMADQFALNAIGPALCLRHAARLLPRKGPSVWATLTARVGSIEDNRLGGWTSYRAAKAAANQVVRCAAIELARSHKDASVVAVHPGTVATSFTEKYVGRHPAVPAAEAANNLLRVLGDLGPESTGQFFDWQGARVPW
ncbi:SDR family NAD(P)-dependent oxidoreductase [Roseobacteraceae bacterium S113]